MHGVIGGERGFFTGGLLCARHYVRIEGRILGAYKET